MLRHAQRATQEQQTTDGRAQIECGVARGLLRRMGRTVARSALEEAVYSIDDEIQSNALDTHVSRLRRKLSEAEAEVEIHGIRGVGYLLKERVSDADQLARAVREVAHGGSVIDPKVVEALVARKDRMANSPLATLTEREREVLEQMAQGKNNAATAGAVIGPSPAVADIVRRLSSGDPDFDDFD
jgi:ATP/maltotriose-dependent transcriptional regulator MalT